ncbi:MAG TPA: hypothetical protein VJ872_17900 [Nocardioides sp.]|nr:hypothetical protein [Nocardioides sp.]
MTETTTLPAVKPAAHEAVPPVTIEDDATPVVRLIGQRLRESVRLGHATEVLGRGHGTVAVRSHDTPQAATIDLGDGIAVSGGVPGDTDATVVVDLHARFKPAEEPAGDVPLALAVLDALRPPLPHWRVAAERFWEATRAIPGIPDVLLVETAGPDGPERGRFGTGSTEYLVAGPADLIAGVFTGADDLLAALAAGVQVRGTLAQLSVMTAASWKVRFDV